MFEDPMRLRRYSTNQLVGELARRANGEPTRKPEHWCDECTHFVPWSEHAQRKKPMPDDYNPCEKGHAMQFITPEEIDDEWGHFLHVCADRDLRGTASQEGA